MILHKISKVDWIIEVVTEKLNIKHKLYLSKLKNIELTELL